MIRRPPRSTLSSSSAASDVYKRQLQALGCVQGHQGHHAAVSRLAIGAVGDLVGVSHQRDALEKGLQGARGFRLVELAAHGHELGKVLDPSLVLRVLAGPELSEITGLLN